MRTYTVVLKGKFVEEVTANNPKEAEQLAIRMLTIRVGGAGPTYEISKLTIKEQKFRKL